MMPINVLKNFSPRNTDLETMIAAAESLKILATGFESRGIETPEWVSTKLADCEAEINSMVRSERVAELKKMKARRLALTPKSELLANLDQEIARREALLKGEPLSSVKPD